MKTKGGGGVGVWLFVVSSGIARKVSPRKKTRRERVDEGLRGCLVQLLESWKLAKKLIDKEKVAWLCCLESFQSQRKKPIIH